LIYAFMEPYGRLTVGLFDMQTILGPKL